MANEVSIAYTWLKCNSYMGTVSLIYMFSHVSIGNTVVDFIPLNGYSTCENLPLDNMTTIAEPAMFPLANLTLADFFDIVRVTQSDDLDLRGEVSNIHVLPIVYNRPANPHH